MSLHKFKVKNSNTIFYYDNIWNSLLDSNKNKLSKEHSMPEKYVEFIRSRNADKTKVIKKSNAPIMVKVALGQKCNYSCGYCSQTELGDNSPERWGKSKRAMEIEQAKILIENISKYLDFSRLQRLELWGGETLIYWEEVKLFMEAFDREGLVWYIPTNGSLITQDKIDFWKTCKGTITLGLSHDGYAHTTTRGREFLDDKVTEIRAMQEANPKIQFSFNPVISKENMDLFKLNDFFVNWTRENKLSNIPLSMELITVYNLAEARGDSKSWAITDNNLNVYQDILQKYLKAHKEQFVTEKNKSFVAGDLAWCSMAETGFGFIPYAKTLREEDSLMIGANCQADQEGQLTIDLLGNVKTCQNVGAEFKYGHISNIQEAAVEGLDTNKNPRCQDCKVKFLCNSGCPIVQPDEVFDINCALYKVHYGEIQNAAFELIFNDEVEYLGLDDV